MRKHRRASRVSQTLCLMLATITSLALLGLAAGALDSSHLPMGDVPPRLRSRHLKVSGPQHAHRRADTPNVPMAESQIVIMGPNGGVMVTGVAPDEDVEVFEPNEPADGDDDDSIPADVGLEDAPASDTPEPTYQYISLQANQDIGLHEDTTPLLVTEHEITSSQFEAHEETTSPIIISITETEETTPDKAVQTQDQPPPDPDTSAPPSESLAPQVLDLGEGYKELGVVFLGQPAGEDHAQNATQIVTPSSETEPVSGELITPDPQQTTKA